MLLRRRILQKIRLNLIMNYLKNFYCEDKGKVIKKIVSFLNSGSEKIHLVLDFDMTLTATEKFNTWEIFATHLSAKGRIEYKKAYDKYRPLEVRNKMRLSDALA